MRLHETIGDFFNFTDLKNLSSSEGQPAEDPAKLALIIILQAGQRNKKQLEHQVNDLP
jgi:transposase